MAVSRILDSFTLNLFLSLSKLYCELPILSNEKLISSFSKSFNKSSILFLVEIRFHIANLSLTLTGKSIITPHLITANNK